MQKWFILNYFSMGPVLPFLPVFGKQLGVSEVAMGIITSMLPILFFIGKPLFGFIMDTFQSARKIIFLTLLCITNVFFVMLVFEPVPVDASFKNSSCSAVLVCTNKSSLENPEIVGKSCWSICGSTNNTFVNSTDPQISLPFVFNNNTEQNNCKIECKINNSGDGNFYLGFSFWFYVILMSLGSIGFNIINSISDAICFDVLGDGEEKKYGIQRVWGTIGFGITALIGGFAIDQYSKNTVIKNYSPAFFLAFACMVIDVLCCLKLKLPPLPKSDSIIKDIGKLAKKPHIAMFLVFTVLVGVCDSFIIYYLFWFLEDLAEEHNMMENIKLLEGLTTAAETLGAEILFFVFSGKILEVIGYGHCLTFCFAAYGIRLGLLSLLTNPWWVIPIELVMQGPTYALCYTTIVAYASAVSPPGTSATTQGVVAGLDDGLGYALGSLSGGFLYKWVGGSNALKIYSGVAFVCCLCHAVLYPILREKESSKTDVFIEYQSPKSAAESVTVAS